MENNQEQSSHFNFETDYPTEKVADEAVLATWFVDVQPQQVIQFFRIKNSDMSEEDFEICVMDEQVQIRAIALNGLFYGWQEVKTKLDEKQLSNQLVSYSPSMKERSLMLDMGRKFYSKEWIFSLIDHMCQLKLNTLQLHFSENEGFRIESERYPEIVSDEYLTKKEVREIIAYAKERFIQIIPELDTPGHLKNFLKHYPEWRLERVGEPNEFLDHRALDITNEEAVSAVYHLLTEYFELFEDSTYFHIGADEFIDFDAFHEYPTLQEAARKKYGDAATGIELYIDYTNQLIQKTNQAGFISRVWNDGFYRNNQSSLVTLSKEVQITYWTRWNKNMASIHEYVDLGYEVLNFNDNYFYFVLGEAAGYTYPTAEKIGADWDIHLFAQNQRITETELKSIIGSSFSVWADQPAALTEIQVMEKLLDPLKAYAEKLWINEENEC
ncbi:lacto-N-biosidase [Enterococcus sp. JM4C]|uniref:family 20 glycosylhydrolase n=1 Tax=Candidatus Enterococcus huntleyi TaxID=1857217 RepID=UPI00137A7F49|nr:family 20 glycosylhydrolase [Enterococcus sp. JM4C]KAF1298645.1 lacto-N-biosidase [Enterococcus sp. JM4C]